MDFYAAVCTKCNVGIDGDRTAYSHDVKECEEFKRIRATAKVPVSVRLDQADLLHILAYEKKHGKLPKMNEWRETEKP
jgi:hypothetical protein